ncbi:MAG: TolC family protein [Planctomycetota bacterium]
MRAKPTSIGLGVGLWLLVTAIPGCVGPLDNYGGTDAALRNAVVVEHRKRLLAMADEQGGGLVVEVQRDTSDVEQRLDDERMKELNEMSGAQAYVDRDVEPGTDLAGAKDVELVRLSLDEAIAQAVAANLDLQVARLTPKVAEQQVIQAAAAFDAVAFGSADWQKLDTPQPEGTIPALSNDVQSENFTITTGVRKLTTTGGSFQAQVSGAFEEREPSFFAVTNYNNASVEFSGIQPLLRNFGSDVNTAQITLAKNAEADARALLRQTMNDLVRNVEEGYWNLYLAQRQVLIQQRLLDRTIAERDRLVERADFDVSPVRITEANSRVELRRSDLIRVRSQVRTASDQLKRLINSDELPLADETLVLPTDAPVDSPVSFSLLDAITTAIEQRAELQRALLAISDAAVQQRLADNATLPLLDLTAALAVNGLDEDNTTDAFGNLLEIDFVDYILGLEFEQPLGNRSAEALLQQRKLERQQSVLAYRRDAQDVVLEVKVALRDVLTSYELVGATRAARWAAADSLRSINVQEDVGVALTDEFLLDLKLNAQERLADAEFQEAQALANYMTAIAELYRAQGVLIEQYGIEVEDD